MPPEGDRATATGNKHRKAIVDSRLCRRCSTGHGKYLVFCGWAKFGCDRCSIVSAADNSRVIVEPLSCRQPESSSTNKFHDLVTFTFDLLTFEHCSYIAVLPRDQCFFIFVTLFCNSRWQLEGKDRDTRSLYQIWILSTVLQYRHLWICRVTYSGGIRSLTDDNHQTCSRSSSSSSRGRNKRHAGLAQGTLYTSPSALFWFIRRRRRQYGT